jgi:hypothetical protein
MKTNLILILVILSYLTYSKAESLRSVQDPAKDIIELTNNFDDLELNKIANEIKDFIQSNDYSIDYRLELNNKID